MKILKVATVSIVDTVTATNQETPCFAVTHHLIRELDNEINITNNTTLHEFGIIERRPVSDLGPARKSRIEFVFIA
jgi:hypothetical protein